MNIRDLLPWGRTGAGAGGREEGGQVAPRGSDPFIALQREVNRVFDNAFRDWRLPSPFQDAPFGQGFAGRGFPGGWPTLGVSEQEKAFVVTAEVPGMEEKDIEVSLDDAALVIRGEKKAESTDEKSHVSEHFYGRFERRIPVGPEVDRAGVSAAFKNGVLTVTLPKSAQATPSSRRIPIGGAQGDSSATPNTAA